MTFTEACLTGLASTLLSLLLSGMALWRKL